MTDKKPSLTDFVGVLSEEAADGLKEAIDRHRREQAVVRKARLKRIWRHP